MKPARVVVLNIAEHSTRRYDVMVVRGDACAPPSPIRQQRFDLVYSNSLLEHVGGYERRRQLAEVVHALADWHWVQTPYRYFPIEPH